MEFKDLCAICRRSMSRNSVMRLVPCRHLFHGKCLEENEQVLEVELTCPICRAGITRRESVLRKHYKGNSVEDRKRILECANKGDDWVVLASSLSINYKTAFHWVQSGRITFQKKGGIKPKLLTEDEIDTVISWVEAECDTTLKVLKLKIRENLNKDVALTTIRNYLEGRLFSLKQVHHEPISMNTESNKMKRAEYVRTLNMYIQAGKQIVWIDETNFNLFCRRTRGRALSGFRAVQQLPPAKGPNVHIIGAISAVGIVMIERRRGSYTAALANAWMENLFNQWQVMGNHLNDLVVVCDNAPCHAKFETVFHGTGSTLLRLGPYSPMLNPLEAIWSKMKSFVRNHLRIPEVHHPRVQEQRLVYLEAVVDQAKNSIVGGDCGRAAQHTTAFHAAVLAMEDMPAGR